MEWNRGATVGRGSFATVSLASTVSGELFAVKSTDLSCSTFLQREKDFLSQLSSPHIVKYMGFDITYENNRPLFNLLMEYVPGGSLSDAIKRQGGSIDEPMIRLYTNQILQGLDYLHSNGIVHCDIKGQNILIGKEGVKIGDLGCAKLVGGDVTMSTFSGTPIFMAPEVARGEEQGFPADIWALGCTIIEMATGSNPWPEVNDPVSALYRIGFSGALPDIPRWLSEDVKDLLSKCLKRDSKERWTAKQLLQHPFLVNFESNSEQANEVTENSPTGVLDQGFWDSLELPETPRNLTHISSSNSSPAERIRRLIGGTASSGLNLPNWSWDEEWVSVRSNYIEESEKILVPNCNMNPDEGHLTSTELFVFSVVNVEEVGNSIVDEDLSLECFHEKIGSIDIFTVRTDFVMACGCECVEDIFVSRALSLRKLMKILQFNFCSILNINLHNYLFNCLFFFFKCNQSFLTNSISSLNSQINLF